MNVYIYPTDRDWYSFLSRRRDLDEVNFWRPGGKQRFGLLTPGDLLLFRLGKPDNVIVGGGVYTHFSFAPLFQAWEAFGEKNGTASYNSFLDLVARSIPKVRRPSRSSVVRHHWMHRLDRPVLPDA